MPLLLRSVLLLASAAGRCSVGPGFLPPLVGAFTPVRALWVSPGVGLSSLIGPGLVLLLLLWGFLLWACAAGARLGRVSIGVSPGLGCSLVVGVPRWVCLCSFVLPRPLPVLLLLSLLLVAVPFVACKCRLGPCLVARWWLGGWSPRTCLGGLWGLPLVPLL